MLDPQSSGVQQHAFDVGIMGAIQVVSDDRVAHVGEVNADLMRASGLWARTYENEVVVLQHRLHSSVRGPTPRAHGDRLPALAPVGGQVALELGGPRRERGLGGLSHDRRVGFLYSALRERFAQCAVQLRVAGEDRQPAGVTIQPVDQRQVAGLGVTRGDKALNGGDEVVTLRVDGPVGRQTRRFVDDQQIAVLVYDTSRLEVE